MTTPLPSGAAGHDGFEAAILDGLPEAVIVTAPDGRITYVNAATTRLLGYGLDEAVGQPITLLTPRQLDRRADPVKWLTRWAAEPDYEQARFLDLTARSKDGRQLTVEVRVREGTVDGERRFLITVRDNTARRQEQAALRDQNLRASRILMVAEDAIVSIDAHEVIQDFNLAAEAMFGWKAEEVFGEPLSMLIPPWAQAGHAAHVAEFARSKQPSRMMAERKPVIGRRRSGEAFTLEATITKVLVGGTMSFTAHLRDVTERNRARDQLAEAERRTRAVFDNAHTAIALLAPDGRVLEINKAAADLTDGGAALTGTYLWELPWLGVDLEAAEADGDRLRAGVAAASQGRPSRLTVSLIRDALPVTIDVRLTPVQGEGAVAYVLAEGRIDSRF